MGALTSPAPCEGTDGYASVAATYARLSHRLSRPLAAEIVRRAGLAPGAAVLDVGTGSGIVAVEAARRLTGTGQVVGVDVSPEMLVQAEAAAMGLAGVEFRLMAAEAMDVGDDAFDAVLSLFALPHFRDAAAAVGEMHRALRPGGRLVLGLGSPAPLVSITGVFHRLRGLAGRMRDGGAGSLAAPAFLESIIAASGGAPLRAAPHVGPRSLLRLVHAAGFEDVATSWSGQEAVIGSAEEFWELQATFSTPARAWLAEAGEDARRAVRERFRRGCADVEAQGGRLVYRQGALLVSARRAREAP